MLVLTRKQYESIVIGDDVEVFVCGVVRDRVKLGINAPTSVRVVRAELLAKNRENRLPPTQSEANNSNDPDPGAIHNGQ